MSLETRRRPEGDLPDPAVEEPSRVVLLPGKVKSADRLGHHDYLGGCTLLAELLEQTPGVRALVARDGWPADEARLDGASSLVFYDGGGRKQACFASPRRLARLEERIAGGVGIVMIHRALRHPPELADRVRRWMGGAHVRGVSREGHWRSHHRELPEHPVTRGVRPWRIRDGWLHAIEFADGRAGVTPLLWSGRRHRGSPAGGDADVVAWAYERPGGGRSFAFTGLDDHSAWSVDGVRQLLVNAVLWTAGRAVPEAGAPSVLRDGALERHLTPRAGRRPARWSRLFPRTRGGIA